MIRRKFHQLAIFVATAGVAASALRSAGSARAADSVPPPAIFADAKAQKAFDALVSQGATFVIRTTPAGTEAIEVRLIGKQFDNRAIDHLRLFPSIEMLRFLDTSVDDELLSHLDHFPKLRLLGLFNSPISDAGLATIAKSRVGLELRQLLLGRTKITDAGMKSIATLPRLYLLEISGTAVTDAGITALVASPRLKVLRFRSTAVTDSGMDALRGLKSLLMMSVGNSKVSEAGIARLRAAIPGVVITDEEITVNIEERP